MKKLLSLILAAAMMTTMAFAISSSSVDRIDPGFEMDIEWDEFYYLDEDGDPIGNLAGRIPGVVNGLHQYDFCSDNFTLKVTYKRGEDLVESIKFDDDENVIKFKIKKNNLLESKGKAPNLIFDKFEVKSRRTIKDDGELVLKAGKTFVCEGVLEDGVEVGYDPDDYVHVIEDGEEEFDLFSVGKLDRDPSSGTIDPVALALTYGDTVNNEAFMKGVYVTIAEMGDKTKESKEPKSNMLFDLPDGEGRGESKVYAGDKFFFGIDLDYEDVMDVVKANEDKDFKVYSVTSDGLNTIKIWFENLEEGKGFIYKYNPDTKKLTKANAKFDEEELCYYTTVRGDEILLTAEEALNGVTSGINTENPNTGR